MAHAECCVRARSMLDDDELLWFLRDVDDIWPSVDPAIAPVVPTKRSKTPRRSRRDDILRARQELSVLQQQLQCLTEKRDFRHSVLASRLKCGLDWRRFTAREQVLAKTASHENAALRKRVRANTKLIQGLSRLIRLQQLEAMPKSVRIDCQIVSLDNEAHVYRVLQSSLNIRRSGQLDAILKQCDCVPVDPLMQQTAQWRTLDLADRRVGVEFYESVVMPFSMQFILSELSRCPSLNALEICDNQYVDKLTKQAIPAEGFSGKMAGYVATQSDRRLILRQLVNRRDCTVLLWEDASCWQSDGLGSRVLVRSSGWVRITLVQGCADALSVVHSGGLIQIHATDGFNAPPPKALVEDIVTHAQRLQRRQMTRFEDVLVHASCQQTTKAV